MFRRGRYASMHNAFLCNMIRIVNAHKTRKIFFDYWRCYARCKSQRPGPSQAPMRASSLHRDWASRHENIQFVLVTHTCFGPRGTNIRICTKSVHFCASDAGHRPASPYPPSSRGARSANKVSHICVWHLRAIDTSLGYKMSTAEVVVAMKVGQDIV